MSTIAKKLEQIHISLTNASSDAELQAILTRFGYGIEQLTEGMALYEAVSSSMHTQSKSKLNKLSTTQAFYQQWQLAKFHYQSDLRFARMALKENHLLRQFLQVEGTRPDVFDRWLAKAKVFYSGLQAQPEVLEMVAPSGLSADRVEQGMRYVLSLESLSAQVQTELGSILDTRLQRNEALYALERWMYTFRLVARGALAAYPAYLKMLGLTSEARKTKKIPVMLPAKKAMVEGAGMNAVAR